MKQLPNPKSQIPNLNKTTRPEAKDWELGVGSWEFAAQPRDWDRRSFLKAAGFTLAAASVGCGRAPMKFAIPYLVQPEEMTPGRSTWYASMCGGCEARCGILVKSRDGRPIKIEGNPEHPVSRGGLCAVGQAMALSLYDGERLRHPLMNGARAEWAEVDAKISEKLSGAQRVRVLTGSMIGPTSQLMIEKFLSRFEDGRHLVYDPLSVAAILDTHFQTHGVRALPHYRFDRADIIVGIDADFLGTWISPVEFAGSYSSRRVPVKDSAMSRHIQFESRMSLTGSNADERKRIAPHEIVPLLERIASRVGVAATASGSITSVPVEYVDAVANELSGARGRSLVVCGTNHPEAQRLVNLINKSLDNYGQTLDIEEPSFQKTGSDAAVSKLLDEMESGTVDALFVHGVNPVYDHPLGARIADAIKKVKLCISFASAIDETATNARQGAGPFGFVCPAHHPLESWDDAESVAGLVTVSQPVIMPLGATRSLNESLAAWSHDPRTGYEIIRAAWRERVYPRRKDLLQTFDAFWNKAVHDGFTEVKARARVTPKSQLPNPNKSTTPNAAPQDGRFALLLYPKIAMLDGRHAHNPWLQELPDPVTKVTWDNYASLSPAAAKKIGVTEGDVVRLTLERAGTSDPVDGATISEEFPVFVQPGQHDGVIAVALGYGRGGTDRFALIGPQWLESRPTVEKGKLVGRKASQFLSIEGGHIVAEGMPVSIEKTGKNIPLAATQRHHSLDIKSELGLAGGERIPIVRELTPVALAALVQTGGFRPGEGGASSEGTEVAAAASETLWDDDHKCEGHKWGMAIDLSRCTGCSACVIGCQAENNVPIVGKDEVLRAREMHWIRIDRYYSESATPKSQLAVTAVTAPNPNGDGDVETVHQPMACQHCANAPCETVCPVLATVHSSEGLNQQVYNRCVGTRYCANNCPIKTRRFNWFDYPHEDRLQNMALNPDVTVRTRGVMEKCSFCVQRIAGAKAEAKRLGVELKDGDVAPACVQSCPTKAIVFGDMNDSRGSIVKARKDPRHYVILPELNLDQPVGFLAKIRNREIDNV